LIHRVCVISKDAEENKEELEEEVRGCSISSPSGIPLIIVLLWCGPIDIVFTVNDLFSENYFENRMRKHTGSYIRLHRL
jgi:hypothetical protein